MNKEKLFLVLKIMAFALFITFSPVIICYNDIILDKIKFINEWLSMWGGGIIIALMFYLITETIKYYDNVYSDKKNVEDVIECIDKIINSVINNSVDKNTAITEFSYILIVVGSIKNEKKRKEIATIIMSKKNDIELRLTYLDKKQELINNLNIIKTQCYELK